MTNKTEKTVHRLNRKGNSNYALFIVDKKRGIVEFRQFAFYTGPTLKEKTMTLIEGRALYLEMKTSRIKIWPHDARTTNEWVVAR